MIFVMCMVSFLIGFLMCWLLMRSRKISFLTPLETRYKGYTPKDQDEMKRIKRFYRENVPALTGAHKGGK